MPSETASAHAEPGRLSLRARAPSADRRQEPERERQPARVQVHRGRRAEPQRAEPGVLAELPARERLEQRRRPDGRDPGRELRRQQPPRSAGTGRCSRGRCGRRTTSCSTARSPRRRTASRATGARPGRGSAATTITYTSANTGRDRGRGRSSIGSSYAPSVAAQERRDAVDHVRVVEPWPVAGVGDRLQVALGRRSRTRPPSGPRTTDRARPRGRAPARRARPGRAPAAISRRGSGVAVQAQDRALRALVELLPEALEPVRRATASADAGAAQLASACRRVVEPISSSPSPGGRQHADRARPAEALEQRDAR